MNDMLLFNSISELHVLSWSVALIVALHEEVQIPIEKPEKTSEEHPRNICMILSGGGGDGWGGSGGEDVTL